MRAGERGPIHKRDIRNFDSKTSSSAHEDIMPVHNIWQLQNKDLFFFSKIMMGFSGVLFYSSRSIWQMQALYNHDQFMTK